MAQMSNVSDALQCDGVAKYHKYYIIWSERHFGQRLSNQFDCCQTFMT